MSEALDRHHLPKTAHRAIEHGERLATAVARQFQGTAAAQTGDGLHAAAFANRAAGGAATSSFVDEPDADPATTTASTTAATASPPNAAAGGPAWPHRAAERLHRYTDEAAQRVRAAGSFARDTVEDVRDKAKAVAETGRRAAAAPPTIANDLGKAAKAWGAGLGLSLGWYAAVGAAGIFALVLLTMSAVGALADAIGMPGALLVIGLVYVALAVACMAAARSARAKADRKTRLHLAAARQDVAFVTAPLDQAFGAGGVRARAIRRAERDALSDPSANRPARPLRGAGFERAAEKEDLIRGV